MHIVFNCGAPPPKYNIELPHNVTVFINDGWNLLFVEVVKRVIIT